MRLFDSTYFLNKPQMPSSFTRLRNVNENFIYTGTTLDLVKLKKYVQYNELIFFDIERENLNPESLSNLQAKADQFGPAQHGFFGAPPYQYARDQTSFDTWALRYEKVLSNVDAFFPEMYSYATDPVEWGKCFDFMIGNVRKIAKGKPIYPFLWFIHPYKLPNPPVYIGDAFWHYQINQCRRKADGAVIWGGYLEQWDESAPWWTVLKSYL